LAREWGGHSVATKEEASEPQGFLKEFATVVGLELRLLLLLLLVFW